MSTFEEVQDFVAEQLCCQKDKIKLESRLEEDLNADSLDLVQMAMSMEQIFGLEIPDEDLSGLKKISDIVAYVDERR